MESRNTRIQLVLADKPTWNEDTFSAVEKDGEFLTQKLLNVISSLKDQNRIDVRVLSHEDLEASWLALSELFLTLDSEKQRRS